MSPRQRWPGIGPGRHRRALLAAAAALWLAAGGAQTPADPAAATPSSTELDLSAPRRAVSAAPNGCTSPVLRHCAAAAAMPPAPRSPEAAAAGTASPVQTADQVLERVVIEAQRPRPPLTVREVIEAATARRSWREFESGEGGRCACATPCPPWPQACCVCTKGGREAMIDNLIRH